MAQSTENKLLEKNTQPTSMRILVYDLLQNHHQRALSLAEIEEQFHIADRTTIYRTLRTFEEKGIVHSIQENKTTKYVLCHDGCDEHTHKDWHLHFYCKLCKETTCKEDIAITLPPNMEFRMDEMRFFAKGICEKCLEGPLQ